MGVYIAGFEEAEAGSIAPGVRGYGLVFVDVQASVLHTRHATRREESGSDEG